VKTPNQININYIEGTFFTVYIEMKGRPAATNASRENHVVLLFDRDKVSKII
jgi:hypothetical protein